MQNQYEAKEKAGMFLALGMMSGTSCDGVDGALVWTDGESRFEPVVTGYRAYSPDEKELLAQALKDGAGLEDRSVRPGCLASAEQMVTDVHSALAKDLCAQLPDDWSKPHVIGFHGQTVWHDPAKGITVQLGSGEELAQQTSIPTVFDMRADDVAAGGQGAPLVPIFHKMLAEKAGFPLPCAFVNIGGVSNITWIGASGELTAFDSGPGNALIDDLVRAQTGKHMDKDAMIAQAGQVDFMALVGMMANPYLQQLAPKSLDRNAFDSSFVADLPLENAVATLTAFTSETICLGLEQMEQVKGESAKCLIICGGGQHNPVMVSHLKGALECDVIRAQDQGLEADGMEAQAFAYMAVRHLQNLPLTFPGTTGVAEPMTGGVLFRP
ncbi:MAG: anhydro-N-acetylmuramic acid kinase [Cohaesibacter sp.]|jgi:anhydro-N-acetylmuramic acid kinase|nr:anhydro-N-acetylmuramic acid kinase [Cohaesibacter sp.]